MNGAKRSSFTEYHHVLDTACIEPKSFINHFRYPVILSCCEQSELKLG
jgi:hypothetical protein